MINIYFALMAILLIHTVKNVSLDRSLHPVSALHGHRNPFNIFAYCSPERRYNPLDIPSNNVHLNLKKSLLFHSFKIIEKHIPMAS